MSKVEKIVERAKKRRGKKRDNKKRKEIAEYIDKEKEQEERRCRCKKGGRRTRGQT